MDDEYRVKGSSSRSKFEFVRDRFGEAAERGLKERFHERGLLPVLDSAMYPFAVYDEVNRAITLTGAPTDSEADLNIAGGFYRGAAELLGVEALDWDPTGARFQLQWE